MKYRSSFNKHSIIISFFTMAMMLLNSGCTQRSEVGTKSNPFKFYFMPSDDTKRLESSADELVKFLEKYMSQKILGKSEGFYIQTAVPNSYITVIESFGTKRADAAILNTFAYIMLVDIKKYPVEAILKTVRGNNETSYKAQIITRADSGINKLEDLANKKFAYTDSASTSGFILPKLLFQEKGITLGQTVFAQKHDNVVTMVYQKQVDAGATYYTPPENGEIMDARAKVKTQFPDVEKVVKILALTSDIPNAPVVIRKGVYSDDKKQELLRSAFQDGLLEYSKTPEGKETIKKLYTLSGFIKTNDREYDEMIRTFKKANVDIEKELKK